MDAKPSAIWIDPPPDLQDRLERVLDTGQKNVSGMVTVHFRADDIGVPGKNFTRLLETFARHQTPISLAVVPVWLTPARWEIIRDQAAHLAEKFRNPPQGERTDSLWCWHQHGWRHKNHEPAGKKQEFGPSRSAGDIRRDLHRGRERLSAIMGKAFCPAFTPPWNRIGNTALQLLREMDCRAVSRSRGASPPPEGLPDFPVQVDLHTRKEADPAEGWKNFFGELESSLSDGYSGIMIHHQRMNDAAFGFLDLLLGALYQRKKMIVLKHLGQLGEELQK